MIRWALLGVTVLAAGVVRGFSGFGAGLVMVPSLTLLLGPTVAVPTVVLMEIVASAQLVPPALRLVRWKIVAPLAVAATLMIPVGSLGLAGLDASLLRRVISLIVLVFVAILATGWRYRRKPGLVVTAAVGGASGLLTGLGGVGGPPVILFWLSGRESAPATRASLICYFAITQVVALIAFGASHLLVGEVLVRGLVLAPWFLLATFLGARLFGRVDERRFRLWTLIFLALIALVGLIWRAPVG